MPARNVLMICIDDMRSIGNWGHFSPLVSMPNLERLADLGTTFDRAITQVPICNPSRSSVMSGRQPSETGILENNVPWYERIDPAETLPGVLKAAGVYVAMYGKMFHNHPIPAEDRSLLFNDYRPGAGGQGDPAQIVNDGVRHLLPFRSGRYAGPATDLQDEVTANDAVNFLLNRAGNLDQPFFLGVGLYKPHVHWVVPSQYFNRYDPAEIRAALQASLADGTIIPGAQEYLDVPPMNLPSEVHAQIANDLDLWVDYIHAYLASMSYADAKLGEVLDALQSDPELAADTSIVLWSDNGFHLGDRDRWSKFTPWHESTQVPLIVVDPDAPGGHTARQVVSLVDIYPTVLDLMGIDVPANVELSGNSLLPIVEDVDIGWYDPAAGKGIALSTIFGSFSVRAQVPGRGDLRYTLYPDGTQELYNLTNDPGEHTNRLNFQTGQGRTQADNTLRNIMSGLLDDQLERAGVLMSDGVHRTAGTARDEMLVSTTDPGVNELAGAGGDDTYVLYRAGAIIEAASGGTDVLVIRNPDLERTFVLPANVEVVQVMANFTGNGQANRIYAGFEEVEGLSVSDSGVLRGAGGNDFIDGDAGKDTIYGDAGADQLFGDSGNDLLIGGAGPDSLQGGIGNDVFRFETAAQSAGTAADTIVAFAGPGRAAGDRIDVSLIDANAGVAGNQAFRLGNGDAGTLRITTIGTDTVVLGNTDADTDAELRIVIKDGSIAAGAYTAEDFIL